MPARGPTRVLVEILTFLMFRVALVWPLSEVRRRPIALSIGKKALTLRLDWAHSGRRQILSKREVIPHGQRHTSTRSETQADR